MNNVVFERVCGWNAKRYEQVYHKGLSVSLLREEYAKEWLPAKADVDKLDALCDTVYVAMGVLWKYKATPAEIEYSFMQAQSNVAKLVEANELNPGYFIGMYIDVLEFEDGYPVVQAMCNIITAAGTQMLGMGLTTEQCIEAMLVVCDSNDSKAVSKTAANVKANIDKGADFIAPEPRLLEILAKRKEFN